MAVNTFQLKKKIILDLGSVWIVDVLDDLHVKYKGKRKLASAGVKMLK